MLRSILDTTTAVLRLAQDTGENREEIRAVRGELDEALTIIERLKMEIAMVSEREARERQVLMLQLENLLLRRREELALVTSGEGEGG